MPYRQPVFLFFALLLAVAQPTAWAQTVPDMLPYTGTIAVKDTPAFNGSGQFKFAIINGHADCLATPPTACASFWSNNDTSANGSEPNAAVSIPVTNGVFAVKLGDTSLTNMSAIPPAVFDNATTFLRVWFSDNGTTFEQLSPDRQLVSVPYAFRADVANSVTGAGSIGSTQIDSTQVQRRVTGTCAVGSSIQSVNSDGTVACQTDTNTTYTGGTGISITGTTIGIDSAQVQRRVTGTCAVGNSIRAINPDGTVVCSGGTQVTKRIPISLYGVNLADAAVVGRGFGDSGAVVFPEAGLPQLDFNFTLPQDYVAGTDVVLEITWMSPGTVGTVGLLNNWGTIHRVGAVAIDFNASSPLSVTLTAPIELVRQTDLRLNSSTVLQPGDAISYGIFRNPAVPTDTSTDAVKINGLQIRYTAQQ